MKTLDEKISAYWQKHYANPAAVVPKAAESRIDQFEIQIRDAVPLADPQHRGQALAEMSHPETSPKSRSAYARIALRAAGLDIFSKPKS